MLNFINSLSRRGRFLLAASSFLVLLFFTLAIADRARPSLLPSFTPPFLLPNVSFPLRILQDDASAAEIPPVPCKGPRGSLLDGRRSKDIPEPVFTLPGQEYPETTTGSYETLGLEKTWMTMNQRYGPYGYGERDDVDHWVNVDWGALQDTCYTANAHRFHGNDSSQLGKTPRFKLVNHTGPTQAPQGQTGRQAIILRSWSTFKYNPEDLWNVRSIINEASLATSGDYTVFLLVDVKDKDAARIHEDDAYYQEVLEQSVPREFWGIAVLFHKSLQESWYRKVEEVRYVYGRSSAHGNISLTRVRPFWQIMQPFQLFAHFYPEFDHYWQFEMDTRFTGDVGKMLRQFHKFGTQQPYKQSRERASWTYVPRVHGSYEEMSANINKSLEGGATVWGPQKIRNIDPIGLPPPVEDSKDDTFEWGVGQEADLLLLKVLNEVERFQEWQDWNFKDWYYGFEPGIPRYMSVPAQARASWNLLEAVHVAQHKLGMKIHSEATLPSFAFWHGLKVVGLPLPRFQFPERDLHELAYVLNGGAPDQFKDGIANGFGIYHASVYSFFSRPMTWDWWSSLTDPIFEHWMGEPREPKHKHPADVSNVIPPAGLPSFMREVDGKIYAPSMLLHPRKTNQFRAPEK